MIFSTKPSITETERQRSPNKINKSEKNIPIEPGLLSETSHSYSVSTCLVIQDLDPHQIFSFSSVRKMCGETGSYWQPLLVTVMTFRLIHEHCSSFTG